MYMGLKAKRASRRFGVYHFPSSYMSIEQQCQVLELLYDQLHAMTCVSTAVIEPPGPHGDI